MLECLNSTHEISMGISLSRERQFLRNLPGICGKANLAGWVLEARSPYYFDRHAILTDMRISLPERNKGCLIECLGGLLLPWSIGSNNFVLCSRILSCSHIHVFRNFPLCIMPHNHMHAWPKLGQCLCESRTRTYPILVY